MKKKLNGWRSYSSLIKSLLVMKLTILIIFVSLVSVSASTYSQSTKLTVNAKDASIVEIFEDIEVQSEFVFIYQNETVDNKNKYNIDLKNSTVDEILEILLKDSGTTYEINDRQVIITPKDSIPAKKSTLDSGKGDVDQPKRLTGTVANKDGEPIPGVTVFIKGTTQGTITDLDGNFSIADVPEDAILSVSFIGLKSQEISVAGKNNFKIIMEEDAFGIEEVVAIGYGVAKKSDLTGSTTSVNADDFNNGAIMAPEQLMQGKVSGVNITLNSGEPGANSVVRIRGGTSITAGNDPLYVIDGFPVAFSSASFEKADEDRMPSLASNPLNMINPSDIKSIDILKDASATAIYGSRGANGVILITTKSGQKGKSRIEYDSYVSVSSVRKKIDLLSADEYRNYLNVNQNTIGDWDDGGASTDWQDEIFRTALSHSHNFALIGGGEKTNYRASLNYTNQEGIIISSGLEKIVGRINVNHKTLNDRLSVGVNLTNAMLTNDNSANTESAKGDLTGGVIRDALRYNPTFPVKNSEGEYTFRSVFNQNPVEQAEMIDDDTETFRSLGNVTIDYKITNDLSFNGNAGFTKEFVERMYYAPKASKIGEPFGGRASHETRNNISKLLETNLKYNKQFKERHTIDALLGYSYQDFNYRGTFVRTEKFISDATSYNNLDGGLVYEQPSSYRSGNRLISFYGRLNYNYDNRYLITGSLRRDGSSRFGDNNKWGLFPSAALAWRIIEENFMSSLENVSNLKLRLGYGVTGNQEIGNYLSLPTLSAGTDKYIFGGQVVTAVGPDQYYNPDLKWETTAQVNLGFDFGFWDNKLSGTIDLYKKTTTDLLLRFNVPQPAVVNTTVANVGEVQNKGFELELNGLLVNTDKVRWNWNANISRNVNEVKSLSNETWKTERIFTQTIPAPGFTGVQAQIIESGESMGSFYGYEYIGIDENGVQQYEDLNNDGQILPKDDRKIIGNYNPDFIYGFGSTLKYGRFNFDASFRGAYGMDVLNATGMDIESVSKLPGFNTTHNAIEEGLAYGEATIYSSKWVQDASFLRLDNLTVGYDIDVNRIEWINKASIYLTGQNLFVLTKYDGYDPELSNGLDMTNYPRPRNILLGVRVSF